jgi:hypothetical protein
MANLITGNDGSNTLQGTAGVDVIYGYNPDGPQSNASTIAATRVASGLDQPLFAGAAPGDPGRLFIVEKTSSAATTPTRSPSTSTATACPTSLARQRRHASDIWLMNGSNVTSFAPAGSFNPGMDWHIIA